MSAQLPMADGCFIRRVSTARRSVIRSPALLASPIGPVWSLSLEAGTSVTGVNGAVNFPRSVEVKFPTL